MPTQKSRREFRFNVLIRKNLWNSVFFDYLLTIWDVYKI